MTGTSINTGQLELAVALQQSFLTAAVRHASGADLPAGDLLFRSGGSSRIFRGTPDQVAAVRRFVRTQAGGHPAAADAVLVASELATNACSHTASGGDGGLFMVHLTVITAGHIAILVTDQGSQGQPRPRHASTDQETGRGLDIVTALASVFIPFGDNTARSILAIVGPDHGDHQNDDQEPSC